MEIFACSTLPFSIPSPILCIKLRSYFPMAIVAYIQPDWSLVILVSMETFNMTYMPLLSYVIKYD